MGTLKDTLLSGYESGGVPQSTGLPAIRTTHWGLELLVSVDAGKCQWSKCTPCALPTLSAGGRCVDVSAIDDQVRPQLQRFACRAHEIKKVTYFCYGSLLNPEETSPDGLICLARLAVRYFGQLRCVSLESRAEYVTSEHLIPVLREIAGPCSLEIAIGYETHSKEVRRVLRKGLADHILLRAMRALAKHNCLLKAYVMLKPVHIEGWDDAQWVSEAVCTVVHLASLAKKTSVPLSIHLNPTYVARGTELDRAFKRGLYKPIDAAAIFEVLTRIRNVKAPVQTAGGEMRESLVPVQIGLGDEGLAVPGGTFRDLPSYKPEVKTALEIFNATQDYEVVRELLEARNGAREALTS